MATTNELIALLIPLPLRKERCKKYCPTQHKWVQQGACSDSMGVGWVSRRPFATWEVLAQELGHALGASDFLDEIQYVCRFDATVCGVCVLALVGMAGSATDRRSTSPVGLGKTPPRGKNKN